MANIWIFIVGIYYIFLTLFLPFKELYRTIYIIISIIILGTLFLENKSDNEILVISIIMFIPKIVFMVGKKRILKKDYFKDLS